MKIYHINQYQLPGNKQRNLHSGVTAIEFLIGVAALGVILLLTAPGVSSLLQNHYFESTIKDLASSMTLAKSESERRHITVRICPSSDGATCQMNNDWNKGWLMFSDGNSDNIPQQIELIEAYGPPNKNIRIVASGAMSDFPAFTVAGLSSSQLLTRGEMAVCSRDSNASSSLKLVVNDSGEVNLVRHDGMNCSG